MTKEDLIDRVNKSISLLQVKPAQALSLLHPFVPGNGPVSIDYGIYSLQYALLFGEDIQKKHKDKSLPVEINKLFEDVKKINSVEYGRLLEWIIHEMKQVHDQMKRAKVNLLIDSALYSSLTTLSSINPDQVEGLVLSLQLSSPRHHLLANAYKDMYEISFYLELLANLINICGGEKFSKNPFSGKRINGLSLHDRKGRFIKGLAIDWLKDNSNEFIGKVISSGYDSSLRNMLGGHNDYIYDSSNEIYSSKDGKTSYKYSKVFSQLSNLELLFSALRLEGLKRYYENITDPVRISQIGYIHMHPDKSGEGLIIAQYWANFWNRESEDMPENISFYRPLIQSTEKYICLGFNNKLIFPYDFSFPSTEFSTSLMKIFSDKDKVKITICAVAPKVLPFTNMSNSEITISHEKFLVLDTLDVEVEINKPNLEQLIKYLES